MKRTAENLHWPMFEAHGKVASSSGEETVASLQRAFEEHRDLVFVSTGVGATEWTWGALFGASDMSVTVRYQAPPTWPLDEAQRTGQELASDTMPGALSQALASASSFAGEVVTPTVVQSVTAVGTTVQTAVNTAETVANKLDSIAIIAVVVALLWFLG